MPRQLGMRLAQEANQFLKSGKMKRRVIETQEPDTAVVRVKAGSQDALRARRRMQSQMRYYGKMSGGIK